MIEFRKIHQFVVYAANTPIQYAVAEFLKKEELYLELGSFYQQKRDFFNNLMKETKFKLNPANGTYFQMLDYSNLSDEKDTVYAEWLTKEIGVASIPISVFCETPPEGRFLRFCFAKDDDTLAEAASRLCKL